MKLSIDQVAFLVLGTAAFFGVLYFTDRALKERWRPYFRYFAAALTAGLFFYGLQRYVPDYDRTVKIAKAAIAMAAAGAVFYEAHRKGIGRPVAERWKKFVGITLAIAAITTYFDGFRFGFPKYYHRWDQYHYYMGSKYFHELGYDGLYRCGVVAQDEMGLVKYRPDRIVPSSGRAAAVRTIDMSKEMRDPDKKVRNLGGDNLLMPVKDILAAPEQCRNLFSAERWQEYKADVEFYRIVSGIGYWTDMQKDHGFNPPPVWAIAGTFFSQLAPASVSYLQFLATLDVLYLMGMFAVLFWGFGWRTFAVGAIFWGTQSSAPFYWTGGAFLRQDWLFFMVLSVACIRKRCFKTAGAALVYSGLLRVFPGLVVIGTLVPFVAHLVKHRRFHPDHLKMLWGGVIAAAVLMPTSIWVCGKDSYQQFYRHTIEVHDETPLTNHMGLRVIVAHKFVDLQAAWPPVKIATGMDSGRMKYTRDNSLNDPFEIWKRMRNERYVQYKWVAYGLTGLTLGAFVLIAARIKSLWVAQCLAQIFIIMMSQLTCYYYSFMILGAPLAKLRKPIELGLFGLSAITEIIWLNSYWNDDRYTALTIASLLFCYVLLGLFWRKDTWTLIRDKLGLRVRAAPSAAARAS